MAIDDQVVVLNDDTGESRPPERPQSPNSLFRLLPLVVMVALVLAVVLIPKPSSETAATPVGLEAPPDPPSAIVSSTTTVPDPEAAFVSGARPTNLNGTGVVTSVDHGPDGWLAVTAGSGAVVVHQSPNAVLWEPATLDGVIGENPIGALGDGVVAVVGGNLTLSPSRSHRVGALSTDGGTSWVNLEHTGRFVVRDVSIVGGETYVAGAVGDDDVFGWEGPGRAALWVVDGSAGRLVPVELTDTGANGEARSIVDTASGPMVFGIVDGTPAGWTIDGERQDLTVPDNVLGQGFVAVEASDSGVLYGLVGNQPEAGGWWVWVSDHGENWNQLDSDQLAAPISDLAITPAGQIYGSVPGGGGVLLGEHGLIDPERFAGLSPEDFFWTSSVTVADGISVFGGVAGTEPTLFIEGTNVQPVEVAPSVVGDGERWRAKLTIDLSLQGLTDGDTRPLGSTTVGGLSYLATTTNVFELDGSTGLMVAPILESPTSFGVMASGEIWIATPGSEVGSSLVEIRSDTGAGQSLLVPMGQIFGLERKDGALVAGGWSSAGLAAIEQSESGEWIALNDPSSEQRLLLPVPDGFLGLDVGNPGPDVETLGFSRDLDDWIPLDGWRLERIYEEPVLRSEADPTVVAFPTGLPDPDPVVIPTTDGDIRVWRFGGAMAVQDLWSVHLLDEAGEWTSLPIDVEHGVTGTALFVPGNEPRLAMFDDGLLIFMVWR